jgi:hypothetical protein
VVKGLNALLAVLSTPTSAPVIAATRLRKGSTNTARGAGKLLADAMATARRASARFSITTRLTHLWSGLSPASTRQPGPRSATRTPFSDQDEQRWISDAEVAEVPFTAFTGRRRAEHVTARLPTNAGEGH